MSRVLFVPVAVLVVLCVGCSEDKGSATDAKSSDSGHDSATKDLTAWEGAIRHDIHDFTPVFLAL